MKKDKFNIGKFLLNIIFSPILLIAVGWFFYEDTRKAILFALIIVTAFNVLGLLGKFLKLFLSGMVMNPFGIIKNSIGIVMAIVASAVYWLFYILYYGTNFSL